VRHIPPGTAQIVQPLVACAACVALGKNQLILIVASDCLRVTQVANQTWGVHAVLPEGVIA
jgi:hypothetical protein